MNDGRVLQQRIEDLVPTGGELDLAGMVADELVIDAGQLRGLLLQLTSASDRPPVVLRGIRVTGDLDLRYLTFERPLWFKGTNFDGSVDLTGSTAPAVRFDSGCALNGGLEAADLRAKRVSLSDATVQGCVNLTMARVEGRVHAPGIRVTSTIGDRASIAMYGAIVESVILWGSANRRAELERGINLVDATIRAQVALTKAKVGASPGGWAVALDQAEVGGSLILDGLDACGSVRATGATIGGSIMLTGAALRPAMALPDTDFLDREPDVATTARRALNVSNAEVLGDIDMGKGFTATGMVDLAGARVRGVIRCYGSVECDPASRASKDEMRDVSMRLDLTEAQAVHFRDGFRSTGRVRLFATRVAGPLRLDGASFLHPNSPLFPANLGVPPIENVDALAIDAGSSIVGGNVGLHMSKIAGSVRFNGASIGGDARFEGEWGGDDKRALDLVGARVNGAVFLGWDERRFAGKVFLDSAEVRGPLIADAMSSGAISLASASVRALKLPKAPLALTLTRANYGGITIVGTPGIDLAKSFNRLAGVKGSEVGEDSAAFFADILERDGDRRGAKSVRVAAEQRRLKKEPSKVTRGAGWLHWAVNGYGFRPLRTIGCLFILVLTVGVAASIVPVQRRLVTLDRADAPHTAHLGNLLNVDEVDAGSASGPCGVTFACFNPAAFAIDSVIPLIDLNEASQWRVLRRDTKSVVLQILLWVAAALGWLLSSIFVAGVSRFVRDR